MEPQNCIALSNRTDFTAYVDLLRNLTNGDFSLVKVCKKDVCEALWGSGNPDISGVGMVIGYLFESGICAFLVMISLWLERSAKGHDHNAVRLLLANAARTFFDNAIFFTFAIQAASIVTLSRVDFGINAEGMGGFTMEIAWLVSSLTLLPLLPMLLCPNMFKEGRSADVVARRSSHQNTALMNDEDKKAEDSAHGLSGALFEAREGQRFLLFVICWAMGFCPFFSRMGGTFGESRIGDAPNATITPTEWKTVESVCFRGIHTLTSNERNLITAFGILSYLLLSVVIISKIISSALENRDSERNWLTICHNKLSETFSSYYARLGIGVVVAIASAVQFWAFFRLRQLQSDMTQVVGGNFSDGQWTFGQIVATVVFIPVAAELMFVWRRRLLYLEKQ